MNFTWTTLQVRNMEVSLRFYQEIIGLPLKRRFSPDGVMDLAFLGNEGESEIELISNPGNTKVSNSGISVGFMSQMPLEDIIENIKSEGCEAISRIISPNPGMRFIHVSDPDGHDIQLIQDLR